MTDPSPTHQPPVGTGRFEDPGLLRGDTHFLADLAPNDLALNSNFSHAVFVRSTMAYAYLAQVDTAAAAQADGVIGVFTVDDLGRFPAGPLATALPKLFTQPLLADRIVRFAGEPIVAVVAETEAQALDASELVELDYEPLTPVIDLDQAAISTTPIFTPQNRARLQHDDRDPVVGASAPPNDGNIVDRHHRRTFGLEPDQDNAPDNRNIFDGCDVIVEERIMVPRQTAAPIETRGMIATWSTDGDVDHLHIWATTQRPHGFREQLASVLDMPLERIHVTCPAVGGGFGGKPSRGSEEHALPLIARLVGRPVRWVETRSENLSASTHARGERFDLRLGGTNEGRLLAIDVHMVKDTGAYPSVCAFLPGAYTMHNLSGCYGIQRFAFSSTAVVTNTAPISAFRGAGRAPYIVALEQAVDIFADRVGLDPAEIRRLNLIDRAAMPYTTPLGSVLDEADYQRDLQAALDQVDYQHWRREQASRTGSPSIIGIGVASYNHKTSSAGGEEAVVSITADGGAVVYTGTTDQGHGHYTTWAQIASKTLGIPIDRIEVGEGSTEFVATGKGAIGSRSLQTAGVAIHNACDEVIDRARALAAQKLEAAPGDVVFDPLFTDEAGRREGRFHVIGTPARSIGWHAVFIESRSADVDLTCGDLHDPGDLVSFPSGCHVAVVELDIDTGAVRLLRFAAADDAGARLNPTIVEGQLHGGIASGISHALGEVVAYDDQGNLLTGNFGSYQIATADELPMFELVTNEGWSSFNRHGYKGVGESGTVGATPAVYNAVLDALRHRGIHRHLDLPCTPERVWRALTDQAPSANATT